MSPTCFRPTLLLTSYNLIQALYSSYRLCNPTMLSIVYMETWSLYTAYITRLPGSQNSFML